MQQQERICATSSFVIVSPSQGSSQIAEAESKLQAVVHSTAFILLLFVSFFRTDDHFFSSPIPPHTIHRGPLDSFSR